MWRSFGLLGENQLYFANYENCGVNEYISAAIVGSRTVLIFIVEPIDIYIYFPLKGNNLKLKLIFAALYCLQRGRLLGNFIGERLLHRRNKKVILGLYLSFMVVQ